MITFDESIFAKSLKKANRNVSFFSKYVFLHYFNKIIVETACICVSAYFSYSFWRDVFFSEENEYLPIFTTIGVGLTIWLTTHHLKSTYRSKKTINQYIAIVLFSLLAFNVWTDFKGVEVIAENQTKIGENSDLKQIESQYSLTIQNLDKQEAEVYKRFAPRTEKYDTMSLERLRSVYIPTKGNKYHSKEKCDLAFNELEAIRALRISSLSSYQNNLNISRSDFSKKTDDKIKRRVRIEKSYRFGAIIISLMLLVSVWFQAFFEHKVIEENKVSLSEMQAETTLKPRETFFDQKETISITNESTREISKTKEVKMSQELIRTIAEMKMAKGMTNKEIVEEMEVTKGTVTKALQQYLIDNTDLSDEQETEQALNSLGLRPFKSLEERKKEIKIN